MQKHYITLQCLVNSNNFFFKYEADEDDYPHCIFVFSLSLIIQSSHKLLKLRNVQCSFIKTE